MNSLIKEKIIEKIVKASLRGEIKKRQLKKKILEELKEDISELIVDILIDLHNTIWFPTIRSYSLFKFLKKNIEKEKPEGIKRKIFQMYYWPEILFNNDIRKILFEILRGLVDNKEFLKYIIEKWTEILQKIYIKRIS